MTVITIHVAVSVVTSGLVRIHTFPPSMGASEVTPSIDTRSTDGDVASSAVALHVIVGATSLFETTVAPIFPPKEPTYEPPRACVCSHVLWHIFACTAYGNDTCLPMSGLKLAVSLQVFLLRHCIYGNGSDLFYVRLAREVGQWRREKHSKSYADDMRA